MNNVEKDNEMAARNELKEIVRKFSYKKKVKMEEISEAMKELSNEALKLLVKITKECEFIQEKFVYEDEFKFLSGETIQEVSERNRSLALLAGNPEQIYLSSKIKRGQFEDNFVNNWKFALKLIRKQKIEDGKLELETGHIIDNESLKESFINVLKDEKNLGENINNYLVDLMNMNSLLSIVNSGFCKLDNSVQNMADDILNNLTEKEFQALAKYVYENEVGSQRRQNILWTSVFSEVANDTYKHQGIYLLASAVAKEASNDSSRQRKIGFSQDCYSKLKQKINNVEDFDALLALGLLDGLGGLINKKEVVPKLKNWGYGILNQIIDHKELEEGAWGLKVDKDKIKLNFNASEMHGAINRFLLGSNEDRKGFTIFKDVDVSVVEGLKELYSYYSLNYWSEMVGRVFKVILKEISSAIIDIQEGGDKGELFLDIKTKDTVETLNVIEHFMNKVLVTKIENTEDLERVFRPLMEDFVMRRDMEIEGHLIKAESQDGAALKRPKKF